MVRVSGGDPRLPQRLLCPALLWRVGQGGGVRKVRGRWSRGQGSLLWRRHERGGGLGGEESGTQPCAAGLADRNCKVLGCILGAASFSLPCTLTVSGGAAVQCMRLNSFVCRPRSCRAVLDISICPGSMDPWGADEIYSPAQGSCSWSLRGVWGPGAPVPLLGFPRVS